MCRRMPLMVHAAPLLRKWYHIRFFFLKYTLTIHPSSHLSLMHQFHFQAFYLRLKGERL